MSLKSIKYVFGIVLVIIILLFLQFAFRSRKSTNEAHKPSIILITVCTLRADHLGCYGYSRNTSPNIDLFAKDAMLFTKCSSHGPETRLSFPSILSGFFPHETRPRENGYIKHVPLSAEVDTLAEILQPEGYKTLAVVSNFVLRKQPNLFKQGLKALINYYIFGERIGYEQGFEVYDDSLTGRVPLRKKKGPNANNVTDIAVKLIKKFHKEQMFIWIQYSDTHGPYRPPAGYDKLFSHDEYPPHNLPLNESKSGRGGIPIYQKQGDHRDLNYYISQYDGEIRYMDEHIGRLIDTLKELGLYDNAIIIFTADHGEGMGEHDYYFAHGENLYNSLIHVPLMVKYGNRLTGVREDFVQHIDIVPTILKMVGVETNLPFRGFDLRDENITGREIFSEMSLPRNWGGDLDKFSLVSDGLKLIYTPQRQCYELFNLNDDFQEENNLINDERYNQKVSALKAELHRLSKEDLLKTKTDSELRDLTEEEIEKLKSLGYVR